MTASKESISRANLDLLMDRLDACDRNKFKIAVSFTQSMVALVYELPMCHAFFD